MGWAAILGRKLGGAYLWEQLGMVKEQDSHEACP